MSSLTTPTTKRVAIIGAGLVGATYAYALVQSGLAPEIVLIDINRERAVGEAMDLNHAVPFSRPARVWAGNFEDCAGADITVITAGANQAKGETRLDLAEKNTAILRSIVPEIVKHNPNGVILVASNPVDVLSYITWKISGLPHQRVLGSGTILDTARFRYLLSRYFQVDARSVHAYIAGEHGDSEVPLWSLANIAGMKLNEYCQANNLGCVDSDLDDIFRQTRDAAYEIIQRKGATYYAIASGLMRITEAILRDQDTVLSVSSLISDCHGIDDVYMSLPCIVDHGGVEKVLRLNLSREEEEGLHKSAGVLHALIKRLGF